MSRAMDHGMGLVVFLAWAGFASWCVGVACCVPAREPSPREVEMVACVAANDGGAAADKCAEGVRRRYRADGAP